MPVGATEIKGRKRKGSGEVSASSRGPEERTICRGKEQDFPPGCLEVFVEGRRSQQLEGLRLPGGLLGPAPPQTSARCITSFCEQNH